MHIGLLQKKRTRGVEEMDFPGVLKKEHLEILRGQLKKKWNFQGCSRKTHVEFPWVLVFGLGISKGCHTILQNLENLFSPEFLRLKSQI